MVKLKIRKPKLHNNYRVVTNTCPNCLSTLKLVNGHWSCSGDKLLYWESEFKAYAKLNELEQNKFLLKFSDVDSFLDLYDKWNYVDNKGKRPNFTCDYSKTIANPIVTSTVVIPDPIMIKVIERSLHRPLTEIERRGEKPIWKEGLNYYSEYKRGRTKVVINLINYPNDIA